MVLSNSFKAEGNIALLALLFGSRVMSDTRVGAWLRVRNHAVVVVWEKLVHGRFLRIGSRGAWAQFLDIKRPFARGMGLAP